MEDTSPQEIELSAAAPLVSERRAIPPSICSNTQLSLFIRRYSLFDTPTRVRLLDSLGGRGLPILGNFASRITTTDLRLLRDFLKKTEFLQLGRAKKLVELILLERTIECAESLREFLRLSARETYSPRPSLVRMWLRFNGELQGEDLEIVLKIASVKEILFRQAGLNIGALMNTSALPELSGPEVTPHSWGRLSAYAEAIVDHFAEKKSVILETSGSAASHSEFMRVRPGFSSMQGKPLVSHNIRISEDHGRYTAALAKALAFLGVQDVQLRSLGESAIERWQIRFSDVCSC